jgi:metal-responsive CopG/Arc/MetJ family transcriptional regulator
MAARGYLKTVAINREVFPEIDAAIALLPYKVSRNEFVSAAVKEYIKAITAIAPKGTPSATIAARLVHMKQDDQHA